MISFQQSITTFAVVESLPYELSGTGNHCFAKICKRGLSTMQAKRKISEMTGVPLRDIRHAGLKDTYATATQWLSWPKGRMRQEPADSDQLNIVELTYHTNSLSIGQVAHNQFELLLKGTSPMPDLASLAAPFANFYGRQRFGQTYLPVSELMQEAVDKRSRMSVVQSRLFNDYLRLRLKTSGTQVFDDELWTHSNGKRVFEAPLDEDLQQRFAALAVTPTGPIYGYKVKHRQDELDFLAQFQLEPESFRPWGKAMKGARRPLWVKPEDLSVTQTDENTQIKLTLPSGAYATMFLINAFQSQALQNSEESWPDFTHEIELTP